MLDQLWKEHLLRLDHLRQGIGLRAYAQRDPLNEYKREAFGLFEELLNALRERVISVLSHIELQVTPTEDKMFAQPSRPMVETRQDPAFAAEPAPVEAEAKPARPRRGTQIEANDPLTWGRVARNAPCPCGSGKKYKHCHGRVA